MLESPLENEVTENDSTIVFCIDKLLLLLSDKTNDVFTVFKNVIKPSIVK